MQTRRDQLQAYRFQNRRALAALVTGQPNVLEPPMRRLTVTTLSGIMIAILVAIIFGAIAIIRPSAGDSWKKQGAIVVDSDNNSTYIFTDHKLHPVLNYTSAVLAVSGSSTISQVKVSSSDIAGAKYSYEVGIPDVPSSLPPASSLISFPMSACSTRTPRQTGGTNVRVSLRIGSNGGKSATAVPPTQGVLVSAPGPGKQEYLLYQGQLLAVGPSQVASKLNLSGIPPVLVGTAFLNSVPLGTPLAPPSIRYLNRPARYTIAGRTPRIGSVVTTTDDSYLVLAQGTVQLSPFELALFAGAPSMSATTDQATHTSFPTSSLATPQNPLSIFARLPQNPPKADTEAAGRASVCAVYVKGHKVPHVVLPAAGLQQTVGTGSTKETPTSILGMADSVRVPATKGLLATPAGAPHTVLIISDQGIKYAFSSAKLIAAFGYSNSNVMPVPPQLLTLIPAVRKTGLSRSAALRRVEP